MPRLHDFTAQRLGGGDEALSDYDGKVVLIVNVASKCGNTPQYEGLQTLYDTYRERGFVVLGFPCNQFKKQEPGTDEEIAEFCSTTYGVDFPMFGKIDVNGPGAHPLYRWLRVAAPGSNGRDIEWNFAKFLISKDGTPVQRYGDKFPPSEIASDIEKLL